MSVALFLLFHAPFLYFTLYFTVLSCCILHHNEAWDLCCRQQECDATPDHRNDLGTIHFIFLPSLFNMSGKGGGRYWDIHPWKFSQYAALKRENAERKIWITITVCLREMQADQEKKGRRVWRLCGKTENKRAFWVIRPEADWENNSGLEFDSIPGYPVHVNH